MSTASFIDKTIGIYHFLTDHVTSDMPPVNPKSRMFTPWHKDGKPLVAKLAIDKDLKESVGKIISLLGGLGQAICRGDSVFIKPNFNSPDPYPASTDLNFLRIVTEYLLEIGAKITIGESAGGIWRPTRNVFNKLGVYDLARQLNVELIAFEERTNDWVRVKVDGEYLRTVTVPRAAYEADKIVYLPCPKTHNLAHFSGALKLAVGFMHPGERRALHTRYLQQKIAEINLCWQPNLVIMDCRKAFVTGGPDRGQLVEPRLLLASGDIAAIDIEAIKILLAYGAKNRLPLDLLQLPQIAIAIKHSLGSSDYVTVD